MATHGLTKYSVVGRSVCRSLSVDRFVGHVRKPYKNSKQIGDAIWNGDSGGPKEPCIR